MALDCNDAREALSARLDGEAAGDAEEELTSHLVACEPCRRFAAALGPLTRQLRVRTAEVVPDLAPAILGRLARARRSRRALAVARAAALSLAVAAVPVGVLASGTHQVVRPTHVATPCTARLTGRLPGARASGSRPKSG
jgi:predicted anti-sigma-YlaC factor YlaD